MAHSIRLVAISRLAGIPHRTMVRWWQAGLIRGANHGRGPTNGIMLSREDAIEALALATLRRAGVTLEQLEQLARTLRSEHKKGAAFLASGAAGRKALIDGRGDHLPLADSNGQLALIPMLDLRPMRRGILQAVEQLEQQEREVVQQRTA